MSLRRAKSTLAILPLIAGSLLAAGAGEAQADGYIGAGVGSGSELSGEISNHFTTDEESGSSRILVGERFGALAVEGSIFGTQLRSTSGLMGEGDFSTISLGVDLKYHVGLVGGLEAYGKLGLNKTWLSGPATASDQDYDGRGQALGVGLQYSFNLPLAEVGLWLDYTAQQTELRDGENPELDGSLEMVNLGVSVGF